MKRFLLLSLLSIFAISNAEAGGRRARHLLLNPKSVSASLAFDSRKLSGLAENDPISTWPDLSGNGRNLTSSGTARPLYKTAVQGGQATLRFDDTDGMAGTWSITLTSESVIVCFKIPTPSNFGRFFTQTDGSSDYSSSANYIPLLKNSTGNNINGFKVGDTFLATLANSGQWMIVSAIHSGTSITNYGNGTASTPATSSLNKTITRFGIGVTNLADNSAIEGIPGDYAAIYAFNRALTAPQRRRIEQAIAYSFKIAQ